MVNNNIDNNNNIINNNHLSLATNPITKGGEANILMGNAKNLNKFLKVS